MNKRSLVFLCVTFAFTWFFWGLLAILTQRGILTMPSLIGTGLLMLGGSAPTYVAFIVIHKRKNEIEKKIFYTSLTSFKLGLVNYLYALFVPILIGVLAVLIHRVVYQTPWVLFEFRPWFLFPVFLLNTIIFGGLEEIGWRGIVQEDHRPIPALPFAIVFGLLWSLWHLPLFYVLGVSQSSYLVVPFILQGIVFSFFLTGVYLKTRSLILTVLFHASINATASMGLVIIYTNNTATYLTLAITGLLGAFSLMTIEKQMKPR